MEHPFRGWCIARGYGAKYSGRSLPRNDSKQVTQTVMRKREGKGEEEREAEGGVHRDGLLICKMHSKESCVEFSGESC